MTRDFPVGSIRGYVSDYETITSQIAGRTSCSVPSGECLNPWQIIVRVYERVGSLHGDLVRTIYVERLESSARARNYATRLRNSIAAVGLKRAIIRRGHSGWSYHRKILPRCIEVRVDEWIEE